MDSPSRGLTRHSRGVQRFVGFADVLGFRELVRNNDHQVVLNTYRGLVQWVAVNARRINPYRDVVPVQMRLVSDSVVLWTESDTAGDLLDVSQVMQTLLGLAVVMDVPMRGAIAWGDASHISQTADDGAAQIDAIVGNALVDAYEGEQIQQWAGGRLLPSVIERIRSGPADLDEALHLLLANKVLVEYAIPLKTGAAENGLAIGWPRLLNGFNSSTVEAVFSALSRTIDSDDVREKIQNTQAFLEHVGITRIKLIPDTWPSPQSDDRSD